MNGAIGNTAKVKILTEVPVRHSGGKATSNSIIRTFVWPFALPVDCVREHLKFRHDYLPKKSRK